jgi:hypothetical protein
MFVALELPSAAVIRLSVIIPVVSNGVGNAFWKTIVARVRSKESWKTARISGRWTVSMILLLPGAMRSSVSLGQEVCDGPGAITGSEGALLPLLVSCEVATSLAVTLPKLAVAEAVSAGELCQTGRYKNTCKLGETK